MIGKSTDNIILFESVQRDPEFTKEGLTSNYKFIIETLRKDKMLPPDMWEACDFREYFEHCKKNYGVQVAWDMLYEKILIRDRRLTNKDIVMIGEGDMTFPFDGSDDGDYEMWD